MLGAPNKLTYSVQYANHFDPSYYTNSYTGTIQQVIADLRVQHKIIFKCCRIIEHKADVCIIRGPNFFPPSIRIKMN